MTPSPRLPGTPNMGHPDGPYSGDSPQHPNSQADMSKLISNYPRMPDSVTPDLENGSMGHELPINHELPMLQEQTLGHDMPYNNAESPYKQQGSTFREHSSPFTDVSMPHTVLNRDVLARRELPAPREQPGTQAPQYPHERSFEPDSPKIGSDGNPVRPPSGGASLDPHGDATTKATPKMPACADCKRLKVKCVRSDPGNYVSDCLRCIKKGLVCVTGLHAKRAALEDGHTSSMHLRDESLRRSRFQAEVSRTKMSSRSMRDQLLSSWRVLTARDDLRLQLLDRYEYTSLAKPTNNVLKRGLMSREQVVTRINLYRDHMYPKHDFVACPPAEDLEKMIAESPVLFHVIIDVASQMVTDESQTEISLILHNMVLRTIIDEILVGSIKNFELLRSLVLLTHWYNESEFYHQQRILVLTSLSMSMAYDLGMGGSAVTGSGGNAPPFEQIVSPHGIKNAHSLESYSTWLSTYTTSFQILVANRRPQKSYWNKYTARAVSILRQLSSSKQANQRDRDFKLGDDQAGAVKMGPSGDLEVWELAELKHMQEKIVFDVYKDGNELELVDVRHPDGLHKVQELDRQINEVEAAFEGPSVRRSIGLAITRAFLHQYAILTDYDEAIGRSPFTNFSLNLTKGPLLPQEAESFRKCVQNTIIVLDAAALRENQDIAADITSFWTTVTLACDLLLKCRSCCIFNRNFADVCFVDESLLSKIQLLVRKFAQLGAEFPNCNNAISFNFFIKLVFCHHDARLHHHAARVPMDRLGDPNFVTTLNCYNEDSANAAHKRTWSNATQGGGPQADSSEAIKNKYNFGGMGQDGTTPNGQVPNGRGQLLNNSNGRGSECPVDTTSPVEQSGNQAMDSEGDFTEIESLFSPFNNDLLAFEQGGFGEGFTMGFRSRRESVPLPESVEVALSRGPDVVAQETDGMEIGGTGQSIASTYAGSMRHIPTLALDNGDNNGSIPINVNTPSGLSIPTSLNTPNNVNVNTNMRNTARSNLAGPNSVGPNSIGPNSIGPNSSPESIAGATFSPISLVRDPFDTDGDSKEKAKPDAANDEYMNIFWDNFSVAASDNNLAKPNCDIPI